MRTRKLELLRPDEILNEMRRCPVVYLPLGPLEWHGPQSPMANAGGGPSRNPVTMRRVRVPPLVIGNWPLTMRSG
jgi:hypothetical protein